MPGVDRDRRRSARPAPSTTASAVSRSCTFDVERHELVDHPRVVLLGGVGAELGVALGQPRQLARRARRCSPTLMWWASSAAAASKRSSRIPSEARRRSSSGSRNQSQQALELEVREAVLVEERLHLGERARLEHVLEVGVPDPDAREADARRVRAAVAQVEEAPLAARRAPRPGRRRSSRARRGRCRHRQGNLTVDRRPDKLGCLPPWLTT